MNNFFNVNTIYFFLDLEQISFGENVFDLEIPNSFDVLLLRRPDE